MSQQADHCIQYLHDHHQDFIKKLKEYVGFASVSTDPEHFGDIQRTAEWLADQFMDLGMDNVKIFQTVRNPVVYAETLQAGNTAPTVLIYGHYDVQPPDPIELWTTPPFEASVRGEHIFGRGIADMKGQLLSCLAALEAIQKTSKLPVNLKFMIEGEEEIGSPNLVKFVPDHKDMLACDFVFNLDSGMLAADIPTITYGTRGICILDLTVTGPKFDLHSGLYGGAVANPVQVLCKLVGEMRDENGKIMLPGFYDRVRILSAEERRILNQTPISDEDLLQQTGAPQLWGEAGYTALEQTTIRPTLDANGIFGGFSGTGSKTIIPSSATVKLSMRLVPDQDPVEVADQLRQFVVEHAPASVTWEIKQHGGSPAVIADPHSAPIKKLADALETVWGKQAHYVIMGGSVPVISLFQQHLNVEVINTGFAIFAEARVHSPDENIHLPTWQRGMEALAIYFLSLI